MGPFYLPKSGGSEAGEERVLAEFCSYQNGGLSFGKNMGDETIGSSSFIEREQIDAENLRDTMSLCMSQI